MKIMNNYVGYINVSLLEFLHPWQLCTHAYAYPFIMRENKEVSEGEHDVSRNSLRS